MAEETISVRMPDGTIVENVPKGVTQEEVLLRYNASKKSPLEDPNAGVRQTAHPALVGAMNAIAPPAIGIATSLIPGLGPLSSATAMAGTEEAINQLTKPEEERSLDEAIVNTAKNSILNYSFGKALEAVPKGVRAFRNLQGNSGIPQTLINLRPTFAQFDKEPTLADLIENTFARSAKARAQAASTKLSRAEAQAIASQMAGRPLGFTNLEDLAQSAATKTGTAFDQFLTQSRLYAEEAKNIANQNKLPLTKTITGPQIGIKPSGAPVFLTKKVTQEVQGPVYPDKLVENLLRMKNEVEATLGKPDPNNPLLRDINAALERVNYKVDKAGNVSYDPINFNDAWASKSDWGDKGWGNPNRKDITVVDSRFKVLHNAIDEDIQNSMSNWAGGAKAQVAYAKARQLVRARQLLFEGQTGKAINLKNVTAPDDTINRIIDDNKELKRFLITNEYKFPNGVSLNASSKRGDMKAYQFMRMLDDTFKSTDAKDLDLGKLNTAKLIDNWNAFKTSKSGKLLYNSTDVKNIDEFFDAMQHIDSEVGGTGASRYLTLRVASGTFRLGTVALAGFIAGNSAINLPGALGTAGLLGAGLTLMQVGKIMANPDAALILKKMALGQPLGKSVQTASQIVAYALRNEKIKLIFNNGAESTTQLDANGKVKMANLDANIDKTFDLSSFK